MLRVSDQYIHVDT